jgi:hypothetical protein
MTFVTWIFAGLLASGAESEALLGGSLAVPAAPLLQQAKLKENELTVALWITA